MRTRDLWASLLAAAPLIFFGCGTSSDPPTSSGPGGGGSPGTGGSKGVAGSAGATCSSGTRPMTCAGSCVDLASSATNCGACGMACPTTAPFCSSGMCAATCGAGLMQCSSACVNILGTDTANCGACGKACTAGQTCSSGQCVGGGTAGAGGGTGAGGSSGSGAGGATGAAGSGTQGVRTAGTCPIPAGMISDFEEGPPAADMSPSVINSEGRNGTWYGYNDKANTSEKVTVEASGGTADCDKYALHVVGSGYASYAGLGMNFAGGMTPAVYDGASHQFTGIKFKAKLGSGADSKSPVRLNIAIPATQSKTQTGGACVDPPTGSDPTEQPGCYQHMGKFISPGSGAGQLSSTFQTFTYCFDRDLYPLSLPSIATNAQRDALPSTLLQLQFDFNLGKDYSGGWNTKEVYPVYAATLPFDFWVDDVQFITGDCPNSVPSPSNGSPTAPFPQNKGVGTCTPATNAAKFGSAITTAYQTWLKTFVQDNKVVSPEQGGAITSEAMGYGLMIAAAMGDKTTFDKFLAYVNSNLGGGLMNWKNGSSGSASDADVDIAYALLMANAQWPSGGYKAKSDTFASAISSSDIKSNLLTAGSMFTSQYNPSYFSPYAFRKLGFTSAIDPTFAMVTANVTAPVSGIPTDWCTSSGSPTGSGAAGVTSSIADGNNGAMGYDAARVPWRLGLDVCLGGTNTTALKAIVDYFSAKYPSIDLMKAGFYKANKGASQTFAMTAPLQGTYIGPMGVGGMAMKNDALRDRAFRTLLDLQESGQFNHTYFPTTVGLMTLLALAGDFPTP